MELDAQWQVFAGWAEGALERSGQCHESEIFKAFRTTPGVRSAGVTDEALRDMVRNFHPGVKRTSQGFYKGLKVKPRVDPFTGAVK